MNHCNFRTAASSLWRRGRARRAVVLFLALFVASAALQAADRFYTDLLREGSNLYRQGQFPEATEVTELACFGLLDELQILPQCLVILSLSQFRAGDQESFTKTFQRIAEIESSFQAYSANPLPADLRQEFEDRAAEAIPETTLRSVPAFRGIARKKALARLQNLSKAEQRRSLEALIQEEPQEISWRLRFADLQLDAGDAAQALPHLDQVLVIEPGNGTASCLRGEAFVELRRCASAVEDLYQCPSLSTDAWLARAFGNCLAETSRLAPALAFLNNLQAPLTSDRSIVRLRKRLQKEAKKAGITPTAEDLPALRSTSPMEADEATSASPAASPANPSVGAGEVSTGETRSQATEMVDLDREILEREQLEDLRQQLGSARKASDLDPILKEAKETADRRPDWHEAQHLAAEIAYRSSKWGEAAAYFRRGGDPGDSRPHLLFFMAVSFFETGDLAGAREALGRCQGRLQKTPFVRLYENRIIDGLSP